MATGVPSTGSIAAGPFDCITATERALPRAAAHSWLVTSDDPGVELERAVQARLVAALEAERAHIARELHDVVGQALTAVRLNLLSIDRLDGRAGASGVPIDTSLAVVDDAIRQVRMAAFDLRPAVLDDLGLAPAIRTLCRQVSARSRMAFTCRASVGEARLPSDVESACFRVAQEAITNAVRHSGASRICVSIVVRPRSGTLNLEVRDDGVGFDVTRCAGAVCIGISGMAERAALVGAALEIRSAVGKGTRVTARFRTVSSGAG